MKKLSVYVDGRRKNANGEYTVYVRVFDDRFKKTVKFSAGLTSPVVFMGRAFPADVPSADILTTHLNRVYGIIQQLALLNDEQQMDEFKSQVDEALGRNPKKSKPKYFIDYIRMFASEKTNRKTKSIYDQTFKKVRDYDASATFDSIDYRWLQGYEKRYSRMTTNGRGISLRSIRAVFNWAIVNGYTDRYPFRQFKIKEERTRKRSLTIDQLRLLRDYPVQAWQEEYRDIFMLQFYLIGINISDLLELRKLTDGRCVYRRKKTGRLYDIAVPPEAMEIINKYKGENYLINPLDRYKNVDNYVAHLNIGLKKIGACRCIRDTHGNTRYEYDSLFPELSTYWSRHTWATIAASLDIPKETIGKSLGHYEWDSTTTDIYIAFDNRKIDEANRRVIDYLNEDKGFGCKIISMVP